MRNRVILSNKAGANPNIQMLMLGFAPDMLLVNARIKITNSEVIVAS